MEMDADAPCITDAVWHDGRARQAVQHGCAGQGWKDKGDDRGQPAGDGDETEAHQPEDDEEFDEAAEQFEARYNFRFEVQGACQTLQAECQAGCIESLHDICMICAQRQLHGCS